MKECDKSTRKIHISSNFILSISLLIMFDTLLLRLSLYCNTPLHFTQLHFTTLRYTSPHFTQLHFTTLIDIIRIIKIQNINLLIISLSPTFYQLLAHTLLKEKHSLPCSHRNSNGTLTQQRTLQYRFTQFMLSYD